MGIHCGRLFPEYQIQAENLDYLNLVENDRELSFSAAKVFPTLDPTKLIEPQQAEFALYVLYMGNPTRKNIPSQGTRQSASNVFMVDGISDRSYVPGNLRKRSSFRDQLVIPTTLRPLVM